MREFRCVCLCDAQAIPLLRRAVAAVGVRRACDAAAECFTRREELLYRIRDGCCDAALVALPGALGMESAIGVRELQPKLPMIWISDDADFAVQSYRLQAQVFSCQPLQEQTLIDALEQCLTTLCPTPTDRPAAQLRA